MNAELFVLDFIDSPHAALTKKADYPVYTNFMPWLKYHSFVVVAGIRGYSRRFPV